MIPKIIHYCWITEDNKPLPDLVQKCIQTWKMYLPDYEIKKWDINNFDININNFVKEAYINKKYAFVSDYIRLYALYNYGGIYLDTDVKVLKSLDSFLDNKFFVGFEDEERIATCITGSEKKHIILKSLMESYDNKNFVNIDGSFNMEPNTVLMTEVLRQNGIKIENIYQKNNLITVYPKDFFCPLKGYNGDLNVTKNTFAIHLFNASWFDEKDRRRNLLYRDLYQRYKKKMPNELANLFAKVISTYKIEKIKGIINRIKNKINA